MDDRQLLKLADRLSRVSIIYAIEFFGFLSGLTYDGQLQGIMKRLNPKGVPLDAIAPDYACKGPNGRGDRANLAAIVAPSARDNFRELHLLFLLGCLRKDDFRTGGRYLEYLLENNHLDAKSEQSVIDLYDKNFDLYSRRSAESTLGPGRFNAAKTRLN